MNDLRKPFSDYDQGHAPRNILLDSVTQPPEKKEISRPTMVTVAAVLVLVAGLAILYFSVRGLKIDVSQPPGWEVAAESEREEIENVFRESGSEMVIDHMFTRSTYMGKDSAYVAHVAIEADDDFPETSDMEEMQKYIDDTINTSPEPGYTVNQLDYMMGRYAQSIEPMAMGCGLVGRYGKYNPESVGSLEIFVVRTGDTLVYIVADLDYSEQYPSDVIRYLAETMTFSSSLF